MALCRGRCSHRPLQNALFTAICGEFVAAQRANVGIGPYNQVERIAAKNETAVSFSKKKIKTTKSDHIRHGYGIKSIKGALENNDGLLSLSYKNGIFVCRIIMNNNAGHENDVVCAK